MVVHDVDRPDVNGVPPKMKAVEGLVVRELAGLLPHLSVVATDNLMSSVAVRGAKEPREQWVNGIFHNASYFIAAFVPMNGRRYYDPADPKITVEVSSLGSGVPRFRKYTGTPEKAVAKFKEWIVGWAGPAKT